MSQMHTCGRNNRKTETHSFVGTQDIASFWRQGLICDIYKKWENL